MQLRLVRLSELKDCTLGILLIEGMPQFVTLEPAWKNNVKNISCIPPGEYKGIRVQSPKFGSTFQLTNVPDRDAIEFHPGNTHRDTHGCVLLGLKVTLFDNQVTLMNSEKAMVYFMTDLAQFKEIGLTVVGLDGSNLVKIN